jgi:hypothetical protein
LWVNYREEGGEPQVFILSSEKPSKTFNNKKQWCSDRPPKTKRKFCPKYMLYICVVYIYIYMYIYYIYIYIYMYIVCIYYIYICIYIYSIYIYIYVYILYIYIYIKSLQADDCMWNCGGRVLADTHTHTRRTDIGLVPSAYVEHATATTQHATS